MVRKVINIITSVILVILVALVVVMFITRMAGETPSLFGYHVFRVATDSMEPTLAVGDVILVKSADIDEIHTNDIITYVSRSGELAGSTITHRVITEPEEVDGEYYLYTKGDKDGATVDPQIRYDQVKGKYVATLPFVDKLYTFFLSPAGLIVFIGVIMALFGYEIISLIISYRAAEEYEEEYYEPKNKKKSRKRKKK